MDTILAFWNRLSQVSSLQIHSQCRQIPPTYDRRQGAASVVIEKPDDNTIVFFEKGKWETNAQLAFTNVFRWTLEDHLEHIDLEHLRFGDNHPVFLFSLVPVEKNLLKSLKPHECKEDNYYGSVLFDDHFVHLNWKVLGPKKNELTQMVYC